MAGRRWTYLTVLAVSGMFYLAYQEWFSWLALLIVVFLPLFSLIVSLPAMLKLRAGILCPEKVAMNTAAEAKLAGWCTLPTPPFRGKVRLTRTLTGETWKKDGAVALPTEHCGGLTAVPEKVRVYDHLGLIGIRGRMLDPMTIRVWPKPVQIPDLPGLERFLARAWRPKPGGGFAENHELRLYRPGDGLNQVHWKLTAKTGKLIIREPMEPIRGRVLVTMNLRGTPETLDKKLGRLLWLGEYLLEKELAFELCVLTGAGTRQWSVTRQQELAELLDCLLCAAPADAGDLRQMEMAASWRYHIGGDADEA